MKRRIWFRNVLQRILPPRIPAAASWAWASASQSPVSSWFSASPEVWYGLDCRWTGDGQDTVKNIPRQQFPVCISQITITHIQFANAESICWKPVDMISCSRTHWITIWCFRFVEEGRRRIRRICRSPGPRTSTPTSPLSQKPMSKSPKPTWTMPLTAPLFSTVLHERKNSGKKFLFFYFTGRWFYLNLFSPLNSSPVHQIKYQGQLVNDQELKRQASTSKCSNQNLKKRSFTIRRSSRDPRTKNTGSSTVAHMYRTNAVPFHGSRQ